MRTYFKQKSCHFRWFLCWHPAFRAEELASKLTPTLCQVYRSWVVLLISSVYILTVHISNDIGITWGHKLVICAHKVVTFGHRLIICSLKLVTALVILWNICMYALCVFYVCLFVCFKCMFLSVFWLLNVSNSAFGCDVHQC